MFPLSVQIKLLSETRFERQGRVNPEISIVNVIAWDRERNGYLRNWLQHRPDRAADHSVGKDHIPWTPWGESLACCAENTTANVRTERDNLHISFSVDRKGMVMQYSLVLTWTWRGGKERWNWPFRASCFSIILPSFKLVDGWSMSPISRVFSSPGLSWGSAGSEFLDSSMPMKWVYVKQLYKIQKVTICISKRSRGGRMHRFTATVKLHECSSCRDSISEKGEYIYYLVIVQWQMRSTI